MVDYFKDIHFKNHPVKNSKRIFDTPPEEGNSAICHFEGTDNFFDGLYNSRSFVKISFSKEIIKFKK